jgi:nicotinate-nucleotide adenylyltransferase
MKKRRVGILGGTFDPIHIGHLILAENAYQKFNLDTVWVMPTGDPPHKADKYITSSFHRSNMVKLAIEDNPHLEYSGFELEREGYIYTAETLSLLVKENPDHEYFFIIGADSLFAIEEWKDTAKIFEFSTVLAAKREDLIVANLDAKIESLRNTYHARLSSLDIPNIGISSTMIINKLKNHESIKYFVTEKVEDYIYKHSLYIQ